MKTAKLLFLTATVAMCVSACGKSGNNNNNHTPTEPEYVTVNQFPREVIDNLLAEYPSVDLTVPSIAENQEWHYMESEYGALIKLWTVDSGTTSLESQYQETLTNLGQTVENTWYNTVGYSVSSSLYYPQLAFKTTDNVFTLYVYVGTLDSIEIADHDFPLSQVKDCYEIVYNEFLPSFPIPQFDVDWSYQVLFAYGITYGGIWRTAIKAVDPDAPGDNDNYNGHSMEDDYKSYLESLGWEIDSFYYEVEGYYATNGVLRIQFFSWYQEFKLWVSKI